MKANLFLFLPLILLPSLLYFHFEKKNLLIFTASYIYATLFMNPDMDLSHKIKLFSLRGFFSFPFRLYARFTKHRGLSHSIILGSITRILYLMGVIFVLAYIVHLPIHVESLLQFCKQHGKKLLFCFFGIFTADMFHILLDHAIPSKLKR